MTMLDGKLLVWLAIVALAVLTALAFRAYLSPDALLWFGNLRMC